MIFRVLGKGFVAKLCVRNRKIQVLRANFKHPIELLFFGFDDFGDAGGGIGEFGIGALHEVADGIDHVEEKGLLLAEEAAMADAATKDFAQNVAAAFVRRDHAIVDEEGGGASVVGDDAQTGVGNEGRNSLRG